MLLVKKFGGSSLANNGLIFNAASKIINDYKKKNKVVVIVSAQGDNTDKLISKAKEINEIPSKRELDMFLATGEIQSACLLAIAIHKLGYPAISLNAFQVVIFGSNNYGNSRIKKIKPERILNELDKNNIVIITGFQAINSYNDFVTLGRGGSDTSAVALAAILNADLCEIYTDVDGIYTADPRIIKGAKKIKKIDYDAMLELASLGTVVLHNRSVELAKKYNINLVVKSSLNNNPGSIIGDDQMEGSLINGVAVDKNVAVISVIGLEDEPGMVFKLFALLARKKICVDLIIQSIGQQNTKDISFTVAREFLDETIEMLKNNIDFFRYDHLIFDKTVAKLSIVGTGIASNPKISMMMFEAIYNQGINIKMISTSEIKVSILIKEDDIDRAANAVHENLIENEIDF